MSQIRPDFPMIPPTAPQRSSTAGEAQAAFFRAALNGTAPAVQTQGVQPTHAPQPRPSAITPTQIEARIEDQAATGRLLRPGSLLDIRV